VRENRTQGSVRGLSGNRQSYLDGIRKDIENHNHISMRLAFNACGAVEL